MCGQLGEEALWAARQLLPAWVIWWPLLGTLAGALLGALLGAALVARASRPLRALPPDAHWTERARLTVPPRQMAIFSGVLALAAAEGLVARGPLSRPSPVLAGALPFAAALAVAVLLGVRAENALVRRHPPGARVRSIATWLVVLFPGYPAAIAYDFAAGPFLFSAEGALLGAGVVVAVSLGGGFALGRLLGLVRRPPPRLVEALSRALPPGRKRPGLYTLGIASANAFAFPALGLVGVTEGALQALGDDGLSAVLAHELAHLDEPGGVRAARTVSSLLAPLAMVVAPLLAAAADYPALPALALLLVFALLLATRRLQRSREQRADAAAQAHGPAYATALEALHCHNLAPAALSARASHPDLHDRMVAAGVPPAWPKPARPRPIGRGLLAVGALAALLIGGGMAFRAWAARPDHESRARLLLALAGGGASELGLLGRWHALRGDDGQALGLFAAAEALEPEDSAWPAWLAHLHARGGRCAEAAAALGRVRSLAPESHGLENLATDVGACRPAGHPSQAGEAR